MGEIMTRAELAAAGGIKVGASQSAQTTLGAGRVPSVVIQVQPKASTPTQAVLGAAKAAADAKRPEVTPVTVLLALGLAVGLRGALLWVGSRVAPVPSLRLGQAFGLAAALVGVNIVIDKLTER